MLRNSILTATGLSLQGPEVKASREPRVKHEENKVAKEEEKEDQWDLAQAARYLAGKELGVALLLA